LFAVHALEGDFVRLEPLGPDHLDGLVAAATEDRKSYRYTSVPSTPTEMSAYIEELRDEQESNGCVPFAQVRVADDAVVGATRFLNLRSRDGRQDPYAVEIGGTWLARSAQGTVINPEAKLLLLEFAFETWRVGRVDLQTDARNEQSRAGIAGIGARYEGTLRNWQPSRAAGEDGKLRNSAIYSITAAEWPSVRAHLAQRIAARR